MGKRLTVEEMHKALKQGKAKLRPLCEINQKRKGYNKNYIRAWSHFGKQ